MKFLLLVKFITSLLFKFYLTSFERPLIEDKQLEIDSNASFGVFCFVSEREGLIQL